jgi:hypothetical protein
MFPPLFFDPCETTPMAAPDAREGPTVPQNRMLGQKYRAEGPETVK